MEDTDELAEFRQQWKDELLQRAGASKTLTNVELATELFLKGVAYERRGTHYEGQIPRREDMQYMSSGSSEPQLTTVPEHRKCGLCTGVALHFYRQAIQLVPDIERRLSEEQHVLSSLPEDHGSDEAVDDRGKEGLLPVDQRQAIPSQRLSDGSLEELSVRVNHITLQQKLVSCQPIRPQKMVHISALPQEILTYIFRWVVSSDLDMRSLEVLSMVCHRFYYCARQPQLWRMACLRTWGTAAAIEVNTGVSWRYLYISQPHLLFDGVYISQTSYIRAGEPSLDEFYRPFHTVEYFRYLRFYSDGKVLYLNSPDTPINCVHRLRTLASANSLGVQTGHYTLTGDKLSVEVMHLQQSNESVNRHRQREQQVQQSVRTFHLDLQVRNIGCRRCAKLVWLSYSCHTVDRTSGQPVVTDFPLDKFTPFFFSRVKSFTAYTCGILK